MNIWKFQIFISSSPYHTLYPDIIIGLSDVRRYDLTTKFKHLYVDEIEAIPTRIRSTIHSKGEDAEASRFNDSETHEARGNGYRV